MSVADLLDFAMKQAGHPIVGVSVGAEAIRATWRAQYTPAATAQQIAAGDAFIAAFDPLDAAMLSARKDVDATQVDGNVALQAVAAALWEEIQKCQVQAGQTLRTKAQLLARVKAIYRSLLP